MAPEAAIPGEEIGEEATGLREDLLASSDSVYHRQVAEFQLAQHAERARRAAELWAWAEGELEDPDTNPEYVAFLVNEELRKLKARQREDLARILEEKTLEKADRDWGIYHFHRKDA